MNATRDSLTSALRAAEIRAGRMLLALALAAPERAADLALALTAPPARHGLPIGAGTPELAALGARVAHARNVTAALDDLIRSEMRREGREPLPELHRDALAAARRPLDPSWVTYPFPDWLPVRVRDQITDFWSGFGRTAHEYDAQRSAGYHPHPNGTRVRLRTFGPERIVEGRFWLCWNNICRVITDAGEVEYAAFHGTPEERA